MPDGSRLESCVAALCQSLSALTLLDDDTLAGEEQTLATMALAASQASLVSLSTSLYAEVFEQGPAPPFSSLRVLERVADDVAVMPIRSFELQIPLLTALYGSNLVIGA